MKSNSVLSVFSTPIIYLVSIGVAVLLSLLPIGNMVPAAESLSQIFMSLLSLVSLPIIFLSIVSSATRSEANGALKQMGKKIVKYTLLTTLLASTVALLVFLAVDPVRPIEVPASFSSDLPKGSYVDYLLKIVPANIIRPFLESNVIGVLVLALLIGLVSFQLEERQRKTLHDLFSSLYALFMKMTGWIIKLIPLALFSFTVLFIRDVKDGLDMSTIGLYLTSVMIANAIQALVVLPLLLRLKGISPVRLARAMFPALSVAFFTKSSTATVPMAVQNAIERAKISPDVARFTIPLCTSINMNACAAFILTTTLFISMSYGITFSPVELIAWIVVATLAAVGNAGVPMGCYFLASALLASMHVPLQLMGVILPFYAIIDAFETAINVWSDATCAVIVDDELKQSAALDAVLE